MGISNLLVLPSIYEGFGIVCAEAFLMKCPVVRSNTPGAMDMSDVCIISEKGNIEKLIENLEYVFNNEKEIKKMIEKAYKKASKEFVSKSMVEKTMTVYKKLIGGNICD